jgi:hypothetical protein
MGLGILVQPESVMYRLLHTAAMAAVLAHMVFGCCLHHAHAQRAGSGMSMADHADRLRDHPADAPHAADCCCDRHQESPDHEGCGGRDCFFVKPDDCSSDDLPTASDSGLPPAPIAANAGEFPRAVCRQAGNLRLLPVRLHLVNQVLLV